MKHFHKQISRFLIGMSLILGVVAFVPPATLGSAPVGIIIGKVTAPGMRDNAGVLVYIASLPGQFAPRETPQVDQHNLRFEPRVLPVVVGTTVNFRNSDDVQHNVFTPSPAGDFFNLGTWPKGQARPHTFTKMGKVDLLCNVHHEMRGYILVLQNPYFALTDAEGNYRIDDVPPGNYQLKVWHERATGPAQPIEISSGSVTANFNLVAR